MKVIFLDIDGVLNKELVKSNSDENDLIELEYGWMNKSLVENLNTLTDETGAKIVVSSSWRWPEFTKTHDELKAFGVTGEIIGQTPHLGKYSVRGNEIYAWIKENENLIGCDHWRFNQYIILDDDSDMLLWQLKHFIQTDAYAGLSESVKHKALNKLNSLSNTVATKSPN